uniref:Copia protein n=1 Tax=Tanacetum cinerariifolium TaxID=118510 RepID=A0A6L2NIN9_TANCI|nr:copia protein [Tanacetum cinerariifolium]
MDFEEQKGCQRYFIQKKAKLMAQGHRKEEGIDYDEVFAPVARIEAFRLFLAFASYMGFMVYQTDVKSVFLYEEIKEEVYVTQPKGFKDPHNPKHVYRVVKASYGLHQVPRAWYASLSTFLLKHHYRRGTIDKTLFIKKDSRHIILVQVYVDDIIFGSTNKAWCDEFEVLMKGEFEMSAMDKYVKDMLKKFDMESVRTATTPYEVPKPKSKDKPVDAVNVHMYRSMIGSLMYLTAYRPDIMFTCKKQTTMATSSTEAEYVATTSCCGQSTICFVKNLVFHQRTKHIEIRHHFIRDANEKNLIQSTLGCSIPRMNTVSCGFLLYFVQIVSRHPMLLVVQVFLLVVLVYADGLVPTGSCTIPTGKGWEAYEQILDFLNRSHIRYALTHHPPIVFDSLVKQFWATATVRTLETGPSEIIATINGNEVVVIESLIRTQLQLHDETGLYEFTLNDVLDGMREIEYPTDGSLTFYKAQAKSVTSPATQDDVNEDNMNERLGMLLIRKRRELVEQSWVKPMNKTQQRDFMRDFVKNQSASVYNQGPSLHWKHPLSNTSTHATPSSSRSRRKKIAKKRVTPIVDVADVNLIKFDSASESDGDPLPYAPYVGWEMVPTPLGSIHAYYDMEEHTKYFTFLHELLHMVEKNDLRKLLGDVDKFYQRQEHETFALILWGDLRVLFQSLDDEDAHAFWRDQESWRIRSWHLYPRAHVHVLETVDGRVIYMFVDVSHPLSEATMERMLRHGLEVPKLLVGGDLTMAEQLVHFIKADLLNAQSVV